MNVSRIRIAVAALSLVGWVAVFPVGVAYADCTTAGDFGAGAGCTPPGDSSGAGKTESWPPTSVDWPPQLNSDSGSANGDKGNGDAAYDAHRHAQRPEAPAEDLVRLDQHLDTAQADRPCRRGSFGNDPDHERDTDPDRDSAWLEPLVMR